MKKSTQFSEYTTTNICTPIQVLNPVVSLAYTLVAA